MTNYYKQMMKLKKELLQDPEFQKRTDIAVQSADMFQLPEKVLQFGSGAFLRAFADYFINRANQQGIFNGRVIIVQSLEGQRADALNRQDGLYTVFLRGLEHGEKKEERCIIASVSRALKARAQWNELLACAHNPQLKIILSNTTEVGISLDEQDAMVLRPPRSFPGKLTAFLYKRYQAFDGSPQAGMVIIPCELIDNNGTRLREIVLELSQRWRLPERFQEWLQHRNIFCNSLVDRIVPGTPPLDVLKVYWNELGYEDALLTIAEPFHLWAIEGDEQVKAKFPLTETGCNILVVSDVKPYRILKIRILNGVHTTIAPLAFLLGKNFVKECIDDALFASLIKHTIYDEIIPGLDISHDAARQFADDVLERFRNPFIQHPLINITLQSTSKMRERVIPSIERYYEKTGQVPKSLAFGFSAYIWFMRGAERRGDTIYGARGNERYHIEDNEAEYFFSHWTNVQTKEPTSLADLVTAICTNERLWGWQLPDDFVATVSRYLFLIANRGVEQALAEHLAEF